MACIRRRNSALAKKIATLQLPLQPLFQLPTGPPHPAFPSNIMAFHLLTEDELDSIAHYYHQSTPGHWTNLYPTSMNWDKDFLARHSAAKNPFTTSSFQNTTTASADDLASRHWAEALRQTLPTPLPASCAAPRASTPTPESTQPAMTRSNSNSNSNIYKNRYARLSAADRVRIKRRKIGKFIGLRGMETPIDEIAGRIQASWERAVRCGNERWKRDRKG